MEASFTLPRVSRFSEDEDFLDPFVQQTIWSFMLGDTAPWRRFNSLDYHRAVLHFLQNSPQIGFFAHTRLWNRQQPSNCAPLNCVFYGSTVDQIKRNQVIHKNKRQNDPPKQVPWKGTKCEKRRKSEVPITSCSSQSRTERKLHFYVYYINRHPVIQSTGTVTTGIILEWDHLSQEKQLGRS